MFNLVIYYTALIFFMLVVYSKCWKLKKITLYEILSPFLYALILLSFISSGFTNYLSVIASILLLSSLYFCYIDNKKHSDKISIVFSFISFIMYCLSYKI